MYKKIVEFGPSISSENIGDHLTVSMPTSSYLTKRILSMWIHQIIHLFVELTCWHLS